MSEGNNKRVRIAPPTQNEIPINPILAVANEGNKAKTIYTEGKEGKEGKEADKPKEAIRPKKEGTKPKKVSKSTKLPLDEFLNKIDWNHSGDHLQLSLPSEIHRKADLIRNLMPSEKGNKNTKKSLIVNILEYWFAEHETEIKELLEKRDKLF
jgi:hypothetical protein